VHQESQQAGGKRSTIALQAARVSFVLGLLLFLFLKERPSQSGAAGAPHTHFPLRWGHKVCTGQRQSLRSPGSVPRSHPSQAEHPQARGDLRSRRCRSSPFPPTLLLSNGSAAVREPGARLQAAAEQHGEASAVFLVLPNERWKDPGRSLSCCLVGTHGSSQALPGCRRGGCAGEAGKADQLWQGQR